MKACERANMRDVRATPGTKEEAPILVVDDDPKILQLVRMYLEREGFPVTTARNGMAAVSAIRDRSPRLMILDVMLPALDGFAVLRAARADSDVPILMLSARGSTGDRVSGIASGADDYLPKPFSPAELVVRVKALLRRTGSRDAEHAGALELGDIVVDRDRHEVRRGAERITLTQSEMSLLVALVGAAGRIVTREALLDALYGKGESEALDRTVDVYIRRLRDKLGDDPESPRYIATVRGSGYRALLER